MSLSITNSTLSSLEAKALAELATQTRESLVRVLEKLQKSDLVIAQVTRLSDIARQVVADNTENKQPESPQATNQRYNAQQLQSPIILKFPETYLAVNTEQQAALQTLVGEEVVVNIEAVKPDIKIRIIDTVEQYLAKKQPIVNESDSTSAKNDFTTVASKALSNQSLPNGTILLEVLEQVQSGSSTKVQKTLSSQQFITDSSQPQNNIASTNSVSELNEKTQLTEQQRLALNSKIAEALIKQVNIGANSAQNHDSQEKILVNDAASLKSSSKSDPEQVQQPKIIINTAPTTRPLPKAPSTSSDIPSLLQPQSLTLSDIKLTTAESIASQEKPSANPAIDMSNSSASSIDVADLSKPIANDSIKLLDNTQKVITSTQLPEREPVINETSTKESVTDWTDQAPLANLLQPQLHTKIQAPDAQQFPVLNQAVIQATQRITDRRTTMTDSLQKLMVQLNRLQEWSGSNKRYLRSEQGQTINKASADTIGGLKELQRYMAKPDQLASSQGVKKALQQSGIFAEQKRTKHSPQINTRQANLHADTKVNLQRIVTATLYHLAKLSSLSTSADLPEHSVPQATTPLSTTKSKTVVPNDLVRMIKERLNAYGEQRIPEELPKRLMQLLHQVLHQSNQALQRTELQQLSNLRSDSQSAQWFFELPIWTGRDTDSLQLLMRREAHQIDRELKPSWSLMLQFDMQSLGKIRAVVKWQDGQTSLLFLANKPETVDLLQQEMTTMRERAGRRNINLQDLDVQQTELEEMRFELQGVKA